MKTILVGLILLSFAIPFPAFAIGDVGGGGTLKALARVTKLNRNSKAQLMRANTEREALEIWIQQLPPQKKKRILKILFTSQIIPQLEQ